MYTQITVKNVFTIDFFIRVVYNTKNHLLCGLTVTVKLYFYNLDDGKYPSVTVPAFIYRLNNKNTRTVPIHFAAPAKTGDGIHSGLL